MDPWALIRFAHLLGAVLWVGGQLTLTLVVSPLAARLLGAEEHRRVVAAFGRRFARVTLMAALPLQIATGVALAVAQGVTLASVFEPGYGRVLAAKLGLFCAAMVAAAVHGIAAARGHRGLSRSMGTAGLVCSIGVVLLAAVLAT